MVANPNILLMTIASVIGRSVLGLVIANLYFRLRKRASWIERAVVLLLVAVLVGLVIASGEMSSVIHPDYGLMAASFVVMVVIHWLQVQRKLNIL